MTDPISPHSFSAPTDALRAIMSQPFRHLARGGSVQVYASADDRYVLKLLASPDDIIEWHASDGHALTDLAWARALPGNLQSNAIDHSAADATEIARRIRQAATASFQLAQQKLPTTSGLIHLHLPGPGSDLPKFRCDENEVDPRRDIFVVQHLAQRADRVINQYVEARDTAAARRVIDDIVTLIQQIWTQGIAEQTLNFHNNYGYANGRLILLDIGDLAASRDLVMAHAQQEKILHKKSATWLRQRHPELADYLTLQVRRHLSADAISVLWQNAAG